MPIILLTIGAILGLIGLLADRIGLGRTAGFGASQQSAALIGGVSILIGALFRIDFVALLGSILFAVGLLADVIGTELPAGAWIVKSVMALFGIAFVVAGLSFRHLYRRTA